eukprot:scaffold126202_cov29-Prasinocladus_malaysianus.AAC.1
MSNRTGTLIEWIDRIDTRTFGCCHEKPQLAAVPSPDHGAAPPMRFSTWSSQPRDLLSDLIVGFAS